MLTERGVFAVTPFVHLMSREWSNAHRRHVQKQLGSAFHKWLECTPGLYERLSQKWSSFCYFARARLQISEGAVSEALSGYWNSVWFLRQFCAANVTLENKSGVCSQLRGWECSYASVQFADAKYDVFYRGPHAAKQCGLSELLLFCTAAYFTCIYFPARTQRNDGCSACLSV